MEAGRGKSRLVTEHHSAGRVVGDGGSNEEGRRE
jgi:hypothetical protein